MDENIFFRQATLRNKAIIPIIAGYDNKILPFLAKIKRELL